MSAFSPPAFPAVRPCRKPAAFSLLETVVALLVIAVVLVISGATISKMRASAGTVRCIANLRQLGGAIAAYAAEHNGIIPPGRDYTNGFKYWFMDPEMWAFKYIGYDREAAARHFRCPLDTYVSTHKNYYSYTWNVDFLQDWPLKVSTRNPNAAKIYLREAFGKVLMADGASNAERPPDQPFNGSMGAPGPLNPASSKTALSLSKRHNGGANCLMGDGSVQWYLYDEILTPALSSHW
ncbi:MAG TPA: H-X9-DG-CTERM domain-containing protein [Chthoniobacteraceae bacterium]|nr:H-X9-DG-CTERM domain-containing protein [Chthoniobacteraceae bacterium]